MAKEMLDWSAQLSRARSIKTQRLAQTFQNSEGLSDPEDLKFRARELAVWDHATLRAEPRPILAQEFEGVVIEANDRFVTVAFEMDNGQEQRRFPRTLLKAAQLRVNDVVELQCKLVLLPPPPPLTDGEVEQWEQRHAAFEAAQAKTRQAKSLLEDEG